VSAGARWVEPASLAAALAALAADPALVPIAGGTDVMVLRALGELRGAPLLDLWRLDELRGVTVGETDIVLGALTTYREVARHPALATLVPALVAAARLSGAPAIQNRGTLGGNVANASPAADSPPVLLVLGARVELASVRGRRWIDYAGYHTGYKTTVRAPDELITRLALPRPPADARPFYRKVGARRAQAISKVSVAGLARWRGDTLVEARLAWGAVAPTVVATPRTAAALVGRRRGDVDLARARAILEEELAPIDDLRSTRDYRRRVAGNLLGQFLAETATGPA
jgi:CO/xanthine dehydrogenase FAD-binding subunit